MIQLGQTSRFGSSRWDHYLFLNWNSMTDPYLQLWKLKVRLNFMELELSGCENPHIKQTDHQFAWIFNKTFHNEDSLLSLQSMTEGKLYGWRRARYCTTQQGEEEWRENDRCYSTDPVERWKVSESNIMCLSRIFRQERNTQFWPIQQPKQLPATLQRSRQVEVWCFGVMSVFSALLF